MHNLAAMLDIAINAERIDADEFANAFASSYVAQGIEKEIQIYLPENRLPRC